MTAPAPAEDPKPLISLSPLVRELAAMVFVVLAAAHLAWPRAVGFEFLGLLGFALLVLFLDIESVQWLGVTARRRHIDQTAAAVKALAVPTGPVLPSTAPAPNAADLARSRAPVTRAVGVGASATVVRRGSVHDSLPPSDPGERLLWACEQIRIELIVIAGNAGRLPRRVDWSSYLPKELIEPVRNTGLLPPELERGIREVIRSRNESIHPQSSGALIEPAANLALEVLSKLRSIKRNYIRVRHPDVVLYADSNLQTKRPQRGAILAQVDTDGRVLIVHAFPRLVDYVTGRFVSWEWDPDHIVEGQTWYRDPVTNEVISAFSAAMSFAGREYPEEWRLDLRLPNPDAGLA